VKSRKKRIADIAEKLGVAFAVAAFIQQQRTPLVLVLYFVMAGTCLLVSVWLSVED
jgi:hypothetical protein